MEGVRADTSFRTYHRLVNPQAAIIERLAALLRGRYSYVVIGAHALNAYAEPRSTRDLDVILADADHAAFVREAAGLLPGAVVDRKRGFVTIRRKRKPVADVALASAHPLYAHALASAEERNIPALGTARVPSKEALIALKLLSALAPGRRAEKRHQDETDVLVLLAKRGLDLEAVRRLAARVPGGVELLERLREL